MVDLGKDLSCTTDLDPMFRLVSGQTLVVQALIRRLTTVRGSCIDAPDYGVDIRLLLSAGLTPVELYQIRALVQSQILRDDRVVSATVSVDLEADRTLRISVLAEGVAGTFPFVLAVDQVNVRVLENAR